MEWSDDASAELFEASCETFGMALVLLVIVCFLLVIVLPVVGLVIDVLIILLIAVGSVAGRVLFRRPWLVDVAPPDDTGRPRREWAVRGWRASKRMIRHVADELARGMRVGKVEAPADIPAKSLR
jgi:hypothetical protein